MCEARNNDGLSRVEKIAITADQRSGTTVVGFREFSSPSQTRGMVQLTTQAVDALRTAAA
jgi:hypothetical protein